MEILCVAGSGREWRLTQRVGTGSEGAVYRAEPVAGDPAVTGALVGKLTPASAGAPAYRRRVERLVRHRREPRTVSLLSTAPSRLAWPIERLATVRGGADGYLMPDMRHAFQPFTHLLIPAVRQEFLPCATWQTGLTAAAALARLLSDVHAEGYVVGDLKPDNLWVDGQGRTGMADVDSWQFTDGRETFPGRMRTPGYTAPERIGVGGAPLDRTSDDFILAILVHQLLMSGLHPFAGQPADGSRYLSPDDNLLHGRCRLTDRTSLALPRAVVPADVLPGRLLALLLAAFGESGRLRRTARPHAAAWAQALEAELAPGRLVVCTVNKKHVHTVERPWCPWCDQGERGGDSYPAEGS